MSDYITNLSHLIGAECARLPRAVLYGENINNGSRIVGMCRQLVAPEAGRIINVGDCEATHIGAGFGMMKNGVNAVLFAKQHDFMLLGVDHFVNTYNFIRCSHDMATLGAFTIVAVICDQGYQGPQSSFNSLGDVCSMARVPGFTITNQHDARQVLSTELAKPGFRLIGLSQRLFAQPILDPGFVCGTPDNTVFQYTRGDDATIVCFNFALPQGHTLCSKMRTRGLFASLFSANFAYPLDSECILQSVGRTNRLIVMDDSKSANLNAHRLVHDVAARFPHSHRLVLERGTSIDFGVCDDVFNVDYDSLMIGMAHKQAA